MQKCLLSGTDLEVSRLGLGTASLHHLIHSKDRKLLLAAALDSGFTHFDTAPMYGERMAERELGQFLGVERKNVTIATKIGFPGIAMFERFPPLFYAHRAMGKIGRQLFPKQWDYRPRNLTIGSVEKSLCQSLKALRTDWIDLLLIHEPQGADIDQLLNLKYWLEHQKASGRVRYLGLAGDASNCVKLAQQVPGLFDVLQVEDSIAKHEAEKIISAGLSLQITFGYMRRAATTQDGLDVKTVVREALSRNSRGMVLVSSRNPDRLKMLASLVDVSGV